MQELEFGGLPMKTRQLLDKMSTASTVKSSKPRVAPVGTKIVKNYKGTDYVVRVLEEGFELNGQWFKSLSGIAKHITGMKLSGREFFTISKWGK